MKELKLKLHSVVDLITNSSTVIYTYSQGCDTVLINLLNELKNTFNIKDSIDDMFYISVLCDNDIYHDYLSEKLDKGDWENKELEISNSLLELLKDEDGDWEVLSKAVDKFIEGVKYNKINKPVWMSKAEELENSWTYFTPSTYISIIAKDEKYEKVARLFYDLIYSTDHEATRDG